MKALATLVAACLLSGSPTTAMVASAGEPPLWHFYHEALEPAKYIDLTHAFAPGQPVGAGFGQMKVAAARAARGIPGVIETNEPFSYEKHGAGITAYEFPTDQVGTQLDPPAHMSPLGATISELPPTFAVRPLVVIDVSQKVMANAGYEATVEDIRAWEKAHGRIPAGSVVMFRSDWSKKWSDPQRFTARPFPGITLAALQFLHLQRRILFHGHEPLDTDSSPDFQAEAWLLKHNFTQAEGVTNLDLVPEAGALISIGFAKPEGGTGGFARFVAIVPASWPHGVTIGQASGAPLPQSKIPLHRGEDGVLRRER